MAGEWQKVPLGELYDIRSGLSKPRSEFGSGFPFLSFKDVFYNYFVPTKLTELVNSTEKERASCDVRRGDVFLTRTSETMNELAMSCVALNDMEKATFNGFTKRLRPKENNRIIPEYAAYFFRSKMFRREITAMSTLSTRASLNNEMIQRLRMTLPPTRVQEEIGFILKALDDKIELNRRMNETLEEMARALFKSWFVDFDPVRAKADAKASGTSPDEALAKLGITPDLAPLFPDKFEDSPLGPIPKGWEVGCLGDYYNITMGQSPPGSSYNEEGEGIPFYQGRTDFGVRYPTRRKFCTAPTRFAEVGDTLVSVRAPVGDVNLANERCCVGRGLSAVRHKTGVTSYTLYSMQSLRERFNIFEGEGTVFGSINKKAFHALDWVNVPPDLIAEFERQAGILDGRFESNHSEIISLTEIRDALLPKLLSGEVPIVEAKVERNEVYT